MSKKNSGFSTFDPNERDHDREENARRNWKAKRREEAKNKDNHRWDSLKEDRD